MINLAASPIEWAPVEQAVETAWFGPLKPCLIETCPEIKFIRAPGIKKGETLLGPFSFICTAVWAIEPRPPIPDPIITPVRFFSLLLDGFQPESRMACSAAATP